MQRIEAESLKQESRTLTSVFHRSYLFVLSERCSVIISIMRSAAVPGGKKPMYFPALSTKYTNEEWSMT
jgi:hypothetical protein